MIHLGIAAALASVALLAPIDLAAAPYLDQPEPGTTPRLFAPGPVNTDGVEINGVFSPDGDRFYFARRVDGTFSIFEAIRYDSGWSEPAALSLYADGEPALAVDMTLSPDGQSMYFLGTNSYGDPDGPPDLWVVERDGDGWGVAEALPEPVNSPAGEYYPIVVGDGSLYFVSDRAGGLGNADVYRAQRTDDGSFEDPVNIGPPVNSEFMEGDTFVAPDESYLIVSSRRPDSLGQSDLYLSRRQATGAWSEPANLGPQINTEFTDFCPMVTPDGRFLFFSRRLGTSWKDTPDTQIYWVDAAVLERPLSEDEIVRSLAGQFSSGQIGGSILFWNDAERRVGFRNLERIYPTRRIGASDMPRPLGSRPVDLRDRQYAVNGESFDVGDFLDHPSSIGVLVVQGGDVILEYYAPGNDRETRWVSFSVTKSVTSMLIGAAVADGLIESVEEPVVDYLPRLRGSAYEGVSIADVLHMASGVAWNEDYADPASDVALAGGLNGLDLQRYLDGLPREHAPGVAFNYNTGETNLAGEILRSAIGNNASTYLGAKIWRPFGMAHDANWVLGAPGAGELGGCCISATLRDYARLGLFALAGGVLPDGRRVLPEGWMARSATPSPGEAGYGYLWWLSGDGAYAASGIFGQRIHVDPARDLVIALHGNAPAAVGSDYHAHIPAVIEAISSAFPSTKE